MIDRLQDASTETPSESLEQVLADALGEAAVLRSHGHTGQARSIETLVDKVKRAMRSYITTLSETEAALRSGWSQQRLRTRFPEWEASGFAMLERGKRRYRECIVPIRTDRSAARLAGARGDSLPKVSHG